MEVAPGHTPKDEHLTQFLEALSAPADRAHLFHAALLVSAIQFPDQEYGWWAKWEREVDQLADEARRLLEHEPDTRDGILDFARVFHEHLGFEGNATDFANPENSCLNRVIETRRGLPITLSILMVEVGSRIGLPLYGVGAPGHFLVGAASSGATCYLDPFNGSKVAEEPLIIGNICLQFQMTSEEARRFLEPASVHSTVVRMLQNLKNAYLKESSLDKLLRTLDWLVAAQPRNLTEIRNRGLILLREGEYQRGAQDIACYVNGAPDAEDLPLIRQELARALKRRDLSN